MQSATHLVKELVSSRTLPNDAAQLLEEFGSLGGSPLEIQEGSYWDYKKVFPASRSDDYFGGIVRLVCALHNTWGGIILFGIEDETRLPCGNTVRVNIETFNAVLAQRLSSPIECLHKRYTILDGVDLDVLLVPKRSLGAVPVRFSQHIGKYPAGKIYVRQNHEVLLARSSDMPFLYGSRSDHPSVSDNGVSSDLIRGLPASPSTVKEFVGRTAVVDRLWQWLVHDEEPRTFLYGRGGSGKSTIAFEFARMVTRVASHFKAYNEKSIDAVLYLTAKKQALDTNTGEIVPFRGNDFESAEELFRQIVRLSEWRNWDDVETMSFDGLRREVQELLDTISVLIVIDDIDTLTTQGKDPGMDALYGAAIRAKGGAKILYTLRNAPSHSLAHAIEVPGLEDGEYHDFVRACCKQFRQPEPSEAIVEGPLSENSERRPLIVESVIGLRRTSGSYERALELLQTHAGDEIRTYLFEREYNALSRDNRARYILAALSLSAKPLGFPDLEFVTRHSSQQVNDAIGEVREMFLTVVHDDSSETQFTLGQSTREYIESRRESLDQYANLKERTKHYLNTFARQPKELTRLIPNVRKALEYFEDAKQAMDLLERHRDNPKLSEHPLYQAWVGIVAARHEPPLLERAREAFRSANTLGRLDAYALRNWFYLERTSGTGIDTSIGICNSVLEDERYSPRVHAEFCAKKGLALQTKGEQLGSADPDKALDCLAQALICNLEAYMRSYEIEELDLEKQFHWTSVCANKLAAHCVRFQQIPVFFNTLDRIGKSNFLCDPLVDSISYVCSWANGRQTSREINMIVGVLSHFQRSFIHRSRVFLFSDETRKRDSAQIVEKTIDNCKEIQSRLKSRVRR